MATRYRYKVELRYPYKNNEEVEIDNSNVKSIIINYDYMVNNMPLVLLKVSLDKNMIDDMIKNHKSKYITLKISKYEYGTNIVIYEKYIYDQFTFYLDTNNINTTKDLDYSDNTKQAKDIFKVITLGLIKQSLIDNNKVLINGFHTDKALIDILLCYMTHMKLLIEPLPNNDKLGNVLIPPMSSVTDFLRFVESQYGIYNSKYRFFMDFERAYLLSSNGNKIPAYDENYSTIIFNVNTTTALGSRNQGMTLDKNSKSYNIDIDTSDINLYEDTGTDKVYDTIIGVDATGATKKLNMSGSVTSGNIRIERTNNLKLVDNLHNNIQNNKVMVNIVKTDLDTTVFTMNKEYYIKNYNRLDSNSGKFILNSKKEIYTRDEETFILSTIFTFSKVQS